MEIETLDKNGYRILRIKEHLSQHTDLTVLKELLREHMNNEVQNLALSFTAESYFYSRTIAILVQCLGHIKEREGNFAIVHPNKNMLEMIKLTGLGKLMEMHLSEESVGVQKVRTGVGL